MTGQFIDFAVTTQKMPLFGGLFKVNTDPDRAFIGRQFWVQILSLLVSIAHISFVVWIGYITYDKSKTTLASCIVSLFFSVPFLFKIILDAGRVMIDRRSGTIDIRYGCLFFSKELTIDLDHVALKLTRRNVYFPKQKKETPMTQLLLVSVENPEAEAIIASYENHARAKSHFEKLKDYFESYSEENEIADDETIEYDANNSLNQKPC